MKTNVVFWYGNDDLYYYTWPLDSKLSSFLFCEMLLLSTLADIYSI